MKSSESLSRSNLSEHPRKVINVIYGGESLGESVGYSRKVMMFTSTWKDIGKHQRS